VSGKGQAGSIYVSAATITTNGINDFSATGLHTLTSLPMTPGASDQIEFLGSGAMKNIANVINDPLTLVNGINNLVQAALNTTPGPLTITGSGLTVDGSSGKGTGYVTFQAITTLTLDAPLEIDTKAAAILNANSISQTTNNVLKVPFGTLSLTTTGSAPLGVSQDSPFELKAKFLNVSTQSNAYLDMQDINCTIGSGSNVPLQPSSIGGTLYLSSDKNIYSNQVLTVKGGSLFSGSAPAATIEAGGQLGLNGNPFLLQLSGNARTATLSSGTNSALPPTVPLGLYAQSQGSITLVGTSSSGGDFVLTTANNGSIALNGSIQATNSFLRGTILQTNGSGVINLNSGSAITSYGNVRLLAGGGGYGVVKNPPPNPRVQLSGPGYVEAPAFPSGWVGIRASGTTVITTVYKNYGVTFNPGVNFPFLNNNASIFLNGTNITFTSTRSIPMIADLQDDESNIVRPVAFTEILTPGSVSAFNVAMVEGTTFFSSGAPSNLTQTDDGFNFSEGKIIAEHKGKTAIVHIGTETIELRGAVIAELECRGSSISITNLADSARNSLVVRARDGGLLFLAPGEQIAFGTSVAPKRHGYRVRTENGDTASISEVSLPYLLSRDQLIAVLKNSSVYRKVFRTAACLQAVRGIGGEPYAR